MVRGAHVATPRVMLGDSVRTKQPLAPCDPCRRPLRSHVPILARGVAPQIPDMPLREADLKGQEEGAYQLMVSAAVLRPIMEAPVG